MTVTKVCLIDSYEVYRLGLRCLLADVDGFEIVSEATTKAQGLEYVSNQNTDMVILDTRLSDGSGIEACSQIKAINQDIKIIVLSSDFQDEVIFSSILAGANGFLLKDVTGEDLVKAIKTVGNGESLLDPSITKKVLEYMKNNTSGTRSTIEVLNQQEKRILILIAEGKTNKDIAGTLMLSDKTVKNYVSNILNKLNFNNRAEAAAYAVRNKLVSAEIN